MRLIPAGDPVRVEQKRRRRLLVTELRDHVGDGRALGQEMRRDRMTKVVTPHYDVTAMLVLTDGMENTDPRLAARASGLVPIAVLSPAYQASFGRIP